MAPAKSSFNEFFKINPWKEPSQFVLEAIFMARANNRPNFAGAVDGAGQPVPDQTNVVSGPSFLWTARTPANGGPVAKSAVQYVAAQVVGHRARHEPGQGQLLLLKAKKSSKQISQSTSCTEDNAKPCLRGSRVQAKSDLRATGVTVCQSPRPIFQTRT